MLNKITGLILLSAFSLSAQLETSQILSQVNYSDESLEEANAADRKFLFESYSINLHPITMMKGYLPLTIEMRLSQRISIETGPALVTRPYLYLLSDIKPEVNPDIFVGNILFPGEVEHNINLGWETSFKFYFDRDIWESAYFSLFHSYRRSSATIKFAGFEDQEAFYNRNHFGFKYGRRKFLNERISSAGDNWVMESYVGFSYAAVSSQNYSNVGEFADIPVLSSIFLHYGISIGYLKE
jgi:hypothetical protein